MKASGFIWSAYFAAVFVSATTLALLVFIIVMALPGKVGVRDYIDARISDTPSFVFIALPLSILFLIAPFYAAKWTYRGILSLESSARTRLKRQNEN